MKIPRFSNAIGNLDEDLVEAAAECKKKQNHLHKLGSIAACFAVIIVVGAACSSIAFRRRTYTRRHKR